ncbi:mechanosensitive ion channel family protein [Paratractidigestivibacter sp.]|uniref:mechanosensitive ion channel family protein n=1 Tax=Paratractidigestivibacter sp. TaxID=2847316 RepID=UPI002AC8B4D3|nr:mechanosensitive ion channel domain-containing protein [Paratractidigestivibacter sp.]
MQDWLVSQIDALVIKAVIIAVAVFVALAAQRVVTRLVNKIFEAAEVPNASIVINLLRIGIWSLAVLSVLKPVFGIDPTWVITALGVVSVAISLGLQDTISNIVSGLGLMLARVIRPGDHVTIGSTTGTVTDVTWRSTSLRTRGGDVDVIPNSVLNKTTLTHLADSNAGVCKVVFAVAPTTDLDAVVADIRATVEASVADDLDPRFQIGVNFTGMTAYGTEGQIVLHVADDVGFAGVQNRVVHELHGRAWLANALNS